MAPADKPQVWDLEWEEPHCTITTATEDGSALMLSMTPGDPEPGLSFVQAGKQIPTKYGEAATVTLHPSGKTVQSTIRREIGDTTAVLRLGGLGYQFPAEFAQSASISIQTANGVMSIPITGSDEAIAAMRKCIDGKLIEWGINAAAFDALQKPPTEIEGNAWINPNDYPMDAIIANWSGDVVAKLSVDATGRVTGCNIVLSGGMRSMDDLVCRPAPKNAKYDPAIGPDGKPTAAFRTVDARFRLSDRPPS